MAQSVIGALRIDLALATAKFKEGAKKARDMSRRLADRIKKHSKTIKLAFKAAAAAAAAFAAGLALAVRGSLKEFDKLAKLSRSIGVPVERLTALQHAADLSGVSVDELGRSFRNVARNMQGAARAPTDFSRSLDALGVSWRDANGNFLRADELMIAVADKFKGMEDGAGKTALAMKIFGEEMGPRLVSMLNNGSDGIKQMTDEAERMGLVVSTKAAVAAETFNDNVRRLQLHVTAFANRLTEKLLPTINHIIKRFLVWADEAGNVKSAADSMASGIKTLIGLGLRLGATYQLTTIRLKQFAAIAKASITGSLDEYRRLADEAIKVEQDYRQRMRDLRKADKEGMPDPAGGDGGGGGGQQLTKPPRVVALEQENAALALVNEADRERLAIMNEMRSPYEVMIDQQARLNELFGGGAKDAELLAKKHQMAALTMHNAYAQAASSVSGALANLFSKNKGVAIANALINTYEAVTAALKNPPGPPYTIPFAAAAAAQGFAQVAAIRSTSKSGTGGGGAGAGASAAAVGNTAAAQPQQQQSFNINLQGDNFSRDGVRGLIENINDAISDGAVLRVA